jgi:hypothetical protein
VKKPTKSAGYRSNWKPWTDAGGAFGFPLLIDVWDRLDLPTHSGRADRPWLAIYIIDLFKEFRVSAYCGTDEHEHPALLGGAPYVHSTRAIGLGARFRVEQVVLAATDFSRRATEPPVNFYSISLLVRLNI